MAFQGNFGRVTDIKFKTLSCGTNQIVDKDCFLTVPGAKIRGDLTVNNDTLICGNLTVKGSSNLLIGNSLTLDTLDMNCGTIGNVELLDVKGNVSVDNDVLICGNLTVKGTVTANLMNMVIGNTLVLDTLDMNCGTIGNVELLEVNTIVSKGGNAVGVLTDVVVFNSPPIFNVTTSGGGLRNQFWGFESGYALGASLNRDNVAMGYNALRNLSFFGQGPIGAVAIGSYALSQYGRASHSVAIGFRTMSNGNNFSQESVAIGSFAMENGGFRHVAIGYSAARSVSSSSSYCVFIGSLSGYSCANTSRAVGIGASTLYDAINCRRSLAIGGYSMKYASSCRGAIAHGGYSMYSATDCGYSFSIGYYTMANAVRCNNTIAIGSYSMNSATDCPDCIVLGNRAMYNAVDKSRVIAIGFEALYSNTTAEPYSLTKSIFIGQQVCRDSQAEHSYDTFIGHYSGLSMNLGTTSYSNVALGPNNFNDAGGVGEVLFKNIGIGSYCFETFTEGSYNIGVGDRVMANVSFGSNNIAMGRNALFLVNAPLTPVVDNIAIGQLSMQVLIGGSSRNIAIGRGARVSAVTLALNSIAIGFSAYCALTPSGAIAIGQSARSDGSNSIAMGRYSRAPANSVAIGNSAGSAAYTNCVALGNGAVNTVNNQISLGGATHTSLRLGGGATALTAVAVPTNANAAAALVPVGGIYRDTADPANLYMRTA